MVFSCIQHTDSDTICHRCHRIQSSTSAPHLTTPSSLHCKHNKCHHPQLKTLHCQGLCLLVVMLLSPSLPLLEQFHKFIRGDYFPLKPNPCLAPGACRLLPDFWYLSEVVTQVSPDEWTSGHTCLLPTTATGDLVFPLAQLFHLSRTKDAGRT